MNGCRNVAVDQAKAVVSGDGLWLIGEAEAMKCPIKPVSGTIAGKDPAGAIASVRRRCEADNQQSRV